MNGTCALCRGQRRRLNGPQSRITLAGTLNSCSSCVYTLAGLLSLLRDEPTRLQVSLTIEHTSQGSAIMLVIYRRRSQTVRGS